MPSPNEIIDRYHNIPAEEIDLDALNVELLNAGWPGKAVRDGIVIRYEQPTAESESALFDEPIQQHLSADQILKRFEQSLAIDLKELNKAEIDMFLGNVREALRRHGHEGEPYVLSTTGGLRHLRYRSVETEAEAAFAGRREEEDMLGSLTPIDTYIVSYAGPERGGVTKDVAFNRKSFGEGQPQNPDTGRIHTGLDGIEVTLEQDFRDEELAHFFSFAINATRGIDPRNPPDVTDWEEMMKGGLQTALKRINIAFAVYGASRTATHQIVRSTRANFHQQSQRAHYYGDRPSVRMPESYMKSPEVWAAYTELAEQSAAFYRLATDHDVSYQDARFGLLEGTTNFILCEYSLDEFINVYAYRGCSMFQWEIVDIVRKMRAALVEAHPWLDPYIKIGCEKTAGAKDMGPQLEDHPMHDAASHTCTFQGWESVEGQCDFPWARETNRAFRSDTHRIEKS